MFLDAFRYLYILINIPKWILINIKLVKEKAPIEY